MYEHTHTFMNVHALIGAFAAVHLECTCTFIVSRIFSIDLATGNVTTIFDGLGAVFTTDVSIVPLTDTTDALRSAPDLIYVHGAPVAQILIVE